MRMNNRQTLNPKLFAVHIMALQTWSESTLDDQISIQQEIKVHEIPEM